MGAALTLVFMEHAIPRYLWGLVNPIPHGQSSPASVVEKVAAKLKMPTFNNQNGA